MIHIRYHKFFLKIGRRIFYNNFCTYKLFWHMSDYDGDDDGDDDCWYNLVQTYVYSMLLINDRQPVPVWI